MLLALLFALAVSVVAAPSPDSLGLALALLAVAVVAVFLGLASPVVSAVYLLTATFFRQLLAGLPLPLDGFLIAFVGFTIAGLIWAYRHPHGARPLGILEAAIALYITWEIGSYIAPHEYAAVYPADGTPVYVFRFMLIGTILPLLLLLLSRRVLVSDRAIRMLLLSMIGFGGYSAYVSITQMLVPGLAFPRYVVTNPLWPGRAVGVFNQPVVNGLVLVLGYLACMLIVARRSEPALLRFTAGVLGAAAGVGVYLTHTRSAWLTMALVVVLGFILARGWRIGFAVTGTAMVVGVTLNWSEFASGDRKSGGVGSTNEIFDRLNIAATSLWAIREKPFAGWGIGRFPSVNTYHHQSLSWQVPWDRGFGLASHFDVLGVGAELGLAGLALWLMIAILVGLRVWRAVRVLPREGLYDGQFAVLAALCGISLLVTGLTVDLRFFDFPNFLIMLVLGAAIGRAEMWRREQAFRE